MADDHPIEVRDCRKRDFFQINNVIIDHYASIIGPFPTLVYTSLCRHADYSTRESYPSHEYLAKELSISRATVKRALHTLMAHRLIGCKHRRSKSGDPDTNIYIILDLWGRVSQTPPHESLNTDETIPSEEVGSHRTDVGSDRPQGGVSQNPGVGSVRATKYTQYEQDSLNNTTTPLTPKVSRKPTRPSGGERDEAFEQFWKAYPRKVKKGSARKAWEHLNPTHSLVESILQAVQQQRTSDQWTKQGGQFIPYPASWLNGEQWLDETTDAGGFDPNGYLAQMAKKLDEQEQAERERRRATD